jgi:uracil-DNA glycosylase
MKIEALGKSWQKELNSEFAKPYWGELADFVKKEYSAKTIYPESKDIFSAFNHTPFNKVKVVILGQDPYHGAGQAHGLCFSVQKDTKVPPSLKNIYKEIKSDIGGKIPEHGNLDHWADQGVLLINSTLTVEAGKPGSHQKKGWEEFTDKVIETVSDKKENVVFILWGNYAKSKKDLIDDTKHLVLESPHPSPFSAYTGFYGSRHFSKTNTYLNKQNKKPISWFEI